MIDEKIKQQAEELKKKTAEKKTRADQPCLKNELYQKCIISGSDQQKPIRVAVTCEINGFAVWFGHAECPELIKHLWNRDKAIEHAVNITQYEPVQWADELRFLGFDDLAKEILNHYGVKE